MLFLLILPVLVAGFLACHIHPVHSYRLHRYEGQYLYLKSAELGLRCFLLALIIALAGFHWLPDKLAFCNVEIRLNVSTWLRALMVAVGAANPQEATKMAWFLLLSCLTFVAAFLIKFWGHVTLWARFKVWWDAKAKVYVIGELLEDSPLDNLLFKLSLERDKYAMLALDDRKVYVGKVISLGEPSETSGMDQDVSIMPLMSGYRDKDTLVVEFTTYYSDVDSEIYLSLRQDAIVSATQFDFDAYKKWNESRARKKEEAALKDASGDWWFVGGFNAPLTPAK